MQSKLHRHTLGRSVMRFTALRYVMGCLGLGLMVLGGAEASWAASSVVSGTVTDTHGVPVSGAMITVLGQGPGPRSISVFSDKTGVYHTPSLGWQVSTDTLRLKCRKIGYRQAALTNTFAGEGRVGVDCTLSGVENVADQVAPADWLARGQISDEAGRRDALLLCGDCHALPSKEVQTIAESFEWLTEDERRQAWRDMVHQMREVFMRFFEEEGVAAQLGQEAAKKAGETFINNADEELITPFLTAHIPVNYDDFSLRDWKECCQGPPVGVKGTVIREYQLPVDYKKWTREVVVPKGSRYIWATDKTGDRLVRLDPDTGALKWVPVKTENLGGPHTLLPDAEGNIWISLEDEGTLARFNPLTEEWKIWPPFVDDNGIVMLTHDPAQTARREVGFDPQGRVWITLISHNMIGSVHPETGEVKAYPLPAPKGRVGATAFVYGSAMSSDGKTVWWSQIQGNLGWFNTQTLESGIALEFPRGTGPRRMAIDDQDVLWVPLYGAGQLLAYDTQARKEVGRYDLPNRNAAPYAVTWDPQRKVVWCGTMNANTIYQFNPRTKGWIQYPMPRDGARFRMLTLDGDGNVWGTYGTFPGRLARPTMIMKLEPGAPDT